MPSPAIKTTSLILGAFALGYSLAFLIHHHEIRDWSRSRMVSKTVQTMTVGENTQTVVQEENNDVETLNAANPHSFDMFDGPQAPVK
jgi:hypothetical protein